MVHHDDVIADAVKRAIVASLRARKRVGNGAAFFEEDAVAHALNSADFFLGDGKFEFERAKPRKRFRQAAQIAHHAAPKPPHGDIDLREMG